MYIQCIYLSLILDIEFDEWNEYPYNLERKPFKTVWKCDEWGVSDVGDLALVTIYRCRWQNFDVSGNLLISVAKMASIVNISKLSPTHFVSNIRHQHLSNHQNPNLEMVYTLDKGPKFKDLFWYDSFCMIQYD